MITTRHSTILLIIILTITNIKGDLGNDLREVLESDAGCLVFTPTCINTARTKKSKKESILMQSPSSCLKNMIGCISEYIAIEEKIEMPTPTTVTIIDNRNRHKEVTKTQEITKTLTEVKTDVKYTTRVELDSHVHTEKIYEYIKQTEYIEKEELPELISDYAYNISELIANFNRELTFTRFYRHIPNDKKQLKLIKLEKEISNCYTDNPTDFYIYEDDYVEYKGYRPDKIILKYFHLILLEITPKPSYTHEIKYLETKESTFYLRYTLKQPICSNNLKLYKMKIADIAFSRYKEKESLYNAIYSTSEDFLFTIENEYMGAILPKLCLKYQKAIEHMDYTKWNTLVNHREILKIMVDVSTTNHTFRIPNLSELSKLCNKIYYAYSYEQIMYNLPATFFYEFTENMHYGITQENNKKSVYFYDNKGPTAVFSSRIKNKKDIERTIPLTIFNNNLICTSLDDNQLFYCNEILNFKYYTPNITNLDVHKDTEYIAKPIIEILLLIKNNFFNNLSNILFNELVNFVNFYGLKLLNNIVRMLLSNQSSLYVIQYLLSFGINYIIVQSKLNAIIITVISRIFVEIVETKLYINCTMVLPKHNQTKKNSSTSLSNNYKANKNLQNLYNTINNLSKKVKENSKIVRTKNENKAIVKKMLKKNIKTSFETLAYIIFRTLKQTFSEPLVMIQVAVTVYLWYSNLKEGQNSWFQTKFKQFLMKYFEETNTNLILKYEKKFLVYLIFLPFVSQIKRNSRLFYLIIVTNWVIFSTDKQYWHYSIEAILLYLSFKLKQPHRGFFISVAILLFIVVQFI